MTRKELENKFDQWEQKVIGKSVESEDSSNLDQCFDLAFDYCDFIGIPRETIRHFRAYQIYTQPNPTTFQYFDLIENTLTAVAQKGDILIFGTSIGVSGHVSMCKLADINSVTSVDQNWDTPHYNRGVDPNTGLLIPYTREVTHTYTSILGFLRPKTKEVVETPAPLPEPNPGSAPTFDGQTVFNDGKTYRSYRRDGVLVWRVDVDPEPQIPSEEPVSTPEEQVPVDVPVQNGSTNEANSNPINVPSKDTSSGAFNTAVSFIWQAIIRWLRGFFA